MSKKKIQDYSYACFLTGEYTPSLFKFSWNCCWAFVSAKFKFWQLHICCWTLSRKSPPLLFTWRVFLSSTSPPHWLGFFSSFLSLSLSYPRRRQEPFSFFECALVKKLLARNKKSILWLANEKTSGNKMVPDRRKQVFAPTIEEQTSD